MLVKTENICFVNLPPMIETDTERPIANENITIKDIIHKWRCVAKRLRIAKRNFMEIENIALTVEKELNNKRMEI